MAAQAPDQVTGVRPNGLEDTPMFRVNVNAAKAEAMGVSLSDINQTISTAFGSSYVNDFLNQGRVKKCMCRLVHRSVCCRTTLTSGMSGTPPGQWHRFQPTPLLSGLTVLPVLNVTMVCHQWRFWGKPLPGKVPVKRWILWPRWSQNYPLAWVILDRTFLSGKIIHQPGPDAVCHLANRGVPGAGCLI